MNLYTIILVAAALLPAIILCCYIYKKDRVEKEPLGFLLLLLALGALIAFPVVMVSGPVNSVIDSFFSIFGVEEDGAVLLNPFLYHIYLFVSNTLGVACIEEGFKWLVLFFVTRNSKHFNSYFDGLIYAVFISLGFAAFENILYTLDYGFSTAVVRAFTAVPGHMFDGVLMGTFYSMWNIKNEASKLERAFMRKGVIKIRKPISGKNELVLSYVVPVLAHGVYDYLCSVSSTLSLILFAVLLIVLYITQFRRISIMSKNDADEIGYAISLVCKKYPAVKMLVESAVQNRGASPAAPAPVRSAAPSGIRQTHGLNDFEFAGPKPPQDSSNDNSELLFTPEDKKKQIVVHIDDLD